MTYYGDEAFPALSDEQWARLQAYGSAQEVESGALLWGAGEATHDLILVDSGEAEVAWAATARAAEAVVARFGTGQFAGELGLLTGQATYLSSRVSKPGPVHRISPVCFRQLMDEDPDLSDVILRALTARRRNLRGSEAARSIEILGSEMSPGALALRTYAARQQLPHTWVEIDTPAGAALARAVTVWHRAALGGGRCAGRELRPLLSADVTRLRHGCSQPPCGSPDQVGEAITVARRAQHGKTWTSAGAARGPGGGQDRDSSLSAHSAGSACPGSPQYWRRELKA